MVIDTNIYGRYIDGDPLIWRYLDTSYSIQLPLPVIAELKQGFIGGSRRTHNETQLHTVLSRQAVEILLPTEHTAEIYAELGYLCRQRGRVLGHNDLWIAALAIESGEPLLTADRDYEVLAERMGDLLIVA